MHSILFKYSFNIMQYAFIKMYVVKRPYHADIHFHANNVTFIIFTVEKSIISFLEYILIFLFRSEIDR